MQEFGLSSERCDFVPGNHDVYDLREAYDWRDKPDGLKNGEWAKQGDISLLLSPEDAAAAPGSSALWRAGRE